MGRTGLHLRIRGALFVRGNSHADGADALPKRPERTTPVDFEKRSPRMLAPIHPERLCGTRAGHRDVMICRDAERHVMDAFRANASDEVIVRRSDDLDTLSMTDQALNHRVWSERVSGAIRDGHRQRRREWRRGGGHARGTLR
jgi:hypothetical protein